MCGQSNVDGWVETAPAPHSILCTHKSQKVRFMSAPPSLPDILTSVDTALSNAESALASYTSVPLKNVVKRLAPLETARLNGMLCFAATSLLYTHLRLGGADLRSHPIREEVVAARALFARIEEAGNQLTAPPAAPPTSSISRSTPTISSKQGEAPSTGIGSKRKREEGGAEAEAEGGGEVGSSNASSKNRSDPQQQSLDSKRRSTPQPALNHLNWREEMSKKFKGSL